MDASLWYLLIEDVLLLVVIGVLLYFKQKPYTIFALIFLAVIIATNVALFLGPHNVFLASFPILFFAFTGVSLRRFPPWARITNRRILSTILITLICIVLLSILALIALVIFSHH
jgi:hypothetical protein